MSNVLLGLLGMVLLGSCAGLRDRSSQTVQVTPVPDSVRKRLELAPFYQKYVDAAGLPVLGSSNVTDAALLEAAWILKQVTMYRPEILGSLATNRARVVVMAHNEYTTDLPEQTDMTPKVYWDRRARGLGGRVTSCGEENLLGYPNDPYAAENILIHEFSHQIMGVGMRSIDPTFRRRVREAYRSAMEAGLWEGAYAASDANEYWAEGAQSWFDDNRENDSSHNHVNTRAELKAYDPTLAALCAEVFGELDWRYVKPAQRSPAGRAHLAGYNPSTAPTFQWREASLPDKPKVVIQTDLGEIEVELDARQQPDAVGAFLKDALNGRYRNGEILAAARTKDVDGARQDPRTGFIQGRLNPTETAEDVAEVPPPLSIEENAVFADGSFVLFLADDGKIQSGFAIHLDPETTTVEIEQRSVSDSSLVSVGQVIRGMEVAREIQQAMAGDPERVQPVRIRNAYRVE